MAGSSKGPAVKNRLRLFALALVALGSLASTAGCDRCKALCRKSYNCLSEAHRKGLVEDVSVKRCTEACKKDLGQRGAIVPIIEEALSNACE